MGANRALDIGLCAGEGEAGTRPETRPAGAVPAPVSSPCLYQAQSCRRFGRWGGAGAGVAFPGARLVAAFRVHRVIDAKRQCLA